MNVNLVLTDTCCETFFKYGMEMSYVYYTFRSKSSVLIHVLSYSFLDRREILVLFSLEILINIKFAYYKYNYPDTEILQM